MDCDSIDELLYQWEVRLQDVKHDEAYRLSLWECIHELTEVKNKIKAEQMDINDYFFGLFH